MIRNIIINKYYKIILLIIIFDIVMYRNLIKLLLIDGWILIKI